MAGKSIVAGHICIYIRFPIESQFTFELSFFIPATGKNQNGVGIIFLYFRPRERACRTHFHGFDDLC